MVSRMTAMLARLDAGLDSGGLVYLEAFRQPGTAAHGKLGSVIAFQKAGMSMPMMLLHLRPAPGRESPPGAQDRLLFTAAPRQYVTAGLAPFRSWEAMEAGEAEALARAWFEGDEDHAMLGTNAQVTAAGACPTARTP